MHVSDPKKLKTLELLQGIFTIVVVLVVEEPTTAQKLVVASQQIGPVQLVHKRRASSVFCCYYNAFRIFDQMNFVASQYRFAMFLSNRGTFIDFERTFKSLRAKAQIFICGVKL